MTIPLDLPVEPVPPEAETLLARCQRRVGYTFRDERILRAALTHASGAEHRLASNERLEFLGDAILGFVVCELLFRQFPQFLEGDLTKLKSVVVSRQTCTKISEALGLQEFLILGKGMTTHPTVPPSVLADVFESLIAAIYLDGGDPAARQFIHAYIAPELELAAAGEVGGNYKSLLQQFAQREFGNTPTYTCSMRRAPTTASASRSSPRSPPSVTRRRGAATRKKPSSGRPATPSRS